MNLMGKFFTKTKRIYPMPCALCPIRAQRGSNLLETLLAIGLVAAMTPFVYNRVAEISRDIVDVSVARQIHAWKEPISGFIRKNQADWPEAEIELDEEDLMKMSLQDSSLMPYAAFIDKYRHGGGITVDSYVAFPANLDGLRMRKIAKALGGEAAIADDTGMAYSAAGGWSVESELFSENDLIYRVAVSFTKDDAALFLHRARGDDEILNTMERDILMSRNSITDIDIVHAGTLDSKMVSAWFAAADSFSAEEAAFPDGASLDGNNATFGHIRALGDIMGFRTLAAGRFEGTGGALNWSAQGNIIADRAGISGAVHVGRNLNMKSSFAKTISGFVGVSAYSLAVPFIAAEEIRFANGFGLSISNELSASYSTGPIEFRSWKFPSSTAPKFTELVLRKAGGAGITSAVPTGFEKIMDKGWKELRQKE